MSDYLHECLQRHGEVTRELYGSSQDLQAIERLSAGIIDAGRLTFDDVQLITDAGFWRGGTFWQWPTREEFNQRCERNPVKDLWNLPRRQNAIVEQLLRVFRHIEPVSVVLRFIDPRHFGILSPPVEKILEIGPAHRPRDKYLKYVKDLRTLRQERGFATAAEVDMALWVMHQVIDANRTRSGRLSRVMPEADHWISAFWAHRTLREIRVTNLTSSLFGTMTMADFAEALLPRDARRAKQDQIRLAGRIAAIEFELAVMRIHRASSGQRRDNRAGFQSLRETVHLMDLSKTTREQWLNSIDIRNDAVHGNRLTRDNVEELLRTMRAALDELSRVDSTVDDV